MKVILTHEVTGLGTAGDVVDVKDGYARNFLFRRSLATAWTKGGQKQVDAIAKGRQVREVKSLEEAQSIKGNLESKAVTVTAHADTSRSPRGPPDRPRSGGLVASPSSHPPHRSRPPGSGPSARLWSARSALV